MARQSFGRRSSTPPRLPLPVCPAPPRRITPTARHACKAPSAAPVARISPHRSWYPTLAKPVFLSEAAPIFREPIPYSPRISMRKAFLLFALRFDSMQRKRPQKRLQICRTVFKSHVTFRTGGAAIGPRLGDACVTGGPTFSPFPRRHRHQRPDTMDCNGHGTKPRILCASLSRLSLFHHRRTMNP